MKKPAAKAKLTGVIKENAVSQYIKKATGLRVRVDAVTKFMADFDAVIVAVVDEAKALAQAERRNTILKKDVAAAIGNQDAPMRYMLGERYLSAMGKLAESGNAKTIVLPADIQESLRGILGRSRD